MSCHVLAVTQNSPAEKAGLEAFFDFIVSINGIALDKVDCGGELKRIMAHNEGNVVLRVYSCKSQQMRTVVIHPEVPLQGHLFLGISIRSCSLRDRGQEPRILYVNLCGTDEEKSRVDLSVEVDCACGTTRTVGFQVDFKDPDIYYFAGGRHVALQTDSTTEFGPLDFFLTSCSTPLLIETPSGTEVNSADAKMSSTKPHQSLPISTTVLTQKVSKAHVNTVSNLKGTLANLTATLPFSSNTKRVGGRGKINQSPVVNPRPRHPPPPKLPAKNPTITKREIGEDGWETVRSRSNRSKWSVSSPSSSSSTTDLAMGNGVEISGAAGDDVRQWEEVEETVAAERERIEEKDVALDNAIREEELIEQELLQVEKDFHKIENQGISSQTTRVRTINSNATETDVSSNTVPSFETEECGVEDSRKGDSNEEVVVGGGDEGDDFFFIDLTVGMNKLGEEVHVKDSERIVALREKLMSPARCRDSAETLRKHQAKLAKAEMNRERLLEAKYNRYVELSERFQTLNETMRRLVEERSELIARAEERRKRAVEKRQQVLLDIKRKAHDEESKAKEIAFINYLELQIKRSGFLSSAHAKEIEVGGRLQSREEERKMKLEDRFQKLSAVLERQSKIKGDWELKLAQMQDKRGKTSERILRERQKRAKERKELAQEKARGRNERICALNAAKLAKKEELKKTIEQKQQDTARRHEENIEHIRQKAIELSVPRVSEETTIRICTLCKVVIESEVQELAHLRGRAHLDALKKMDKETPNPSPVVGSGATENFGIKFIADVQEEKVEPGLTSDRNRLKLMKKHCKKLVQKLTASGLDFETNEVLPVLSGKDVKDQTATRTKIQRNIREIDRLVNLFNAQRGTVQLGNSLDRLLVETRKAAVKCRPIQDSLIGMGLFPVLQKVFTCKSPDLPTRVLVSACNLVVGATFRNLYNSVYVIRSSAICSLLEFAAVRWEIFIPDGHRWLSGSPVGQSNQLPVDAVVSACIECMFTVLNVVPDPFDGVSSPKTFLSECGMATVRNRNLSVISYIVGCGMVDRLSIYCSGVRGSVEEQQNVANLLKDSIDLITMLVYSLHSSWDGRKQETTQLLAALESSEIVGAISMCYTLLLHQGAPTRPRAPVSQTQQIPPPPPPGPICTSLVCSTLSLINAIAKVDLTRLQRVLGCEAMSLQFRHIASQLLWQVVPHAESQPNCARLLHELLMALGNFAVGNKNNQMTIQAGQTPTVLQQLCTLPTPYFTDNKLSSYLLPTLIAATLACPENEEILKQQNISIEMLNRYLDSDMGKRNAICKRIRPISNSSPHLKHQSA